MAVIITTARVLPPGNAPTTTTKVNGRSITCALGASIDVPMQDAMQLVANGWVMIASGVCTTALRPTALPGGLPLPVGFDIIDTSLSSYVIWDGKTWRSNAGVAI